MLDLIRLNKEVNELMGSDVPTIREISEGISENKGDHGASVSAVVPVKHVDNS